MSRAEVPPAPRRLRASAVVNILLRGTGVQAAWLVFLLVMAPGWGFLLGSEAVTPIEFRGATTKVDGTVTAVRPLSADNLVVLAYRFEVDGRPLEGKSYAGLDHARIEVGDRLPVEYLEARPEVSRGVGMARRKLRWDDTAFLYIPLVALLSGLIIPIARLRTLRLLARGQAATGTVTALEGTERRRVTFTFADPLTPAADYRAKPELRTVTLETEFADSLGADRDQWVFFDPARPERALLLEALPGVLTVDDDGALKAEQSAVLPLILPILALLVHVPIGVLVWRHLLG